MPFNVLAPESEELVTPMTLVWLVTSWSDFVVIKIRNDCAWDQVVWGSKTQDDKRVSSGI